MVSPDESAKALVAESAPAPTASPPPSDATPAPAARMAPEPPLSASTRRVRNIGVAAAIVIALITGRYGLSERARVAPKPLTRTATIPVAPPPAAAPVEPAPPEPAPSPAAAPPAPADQAAAETAPAPAPESSKPRAPAHAFARSFDGSRWTVQVGAMKDATAAAAERDRLASRGFDVIVESALVGGEAWQRILVGRYATRAEAEQSIPRLDESGTAPTPPSP